MKIDQITNELKRRISFIEKNPPKRAEKFSKLAFYKTWLLMAEFLQDEALVEIEIDFCVEKSGSARRSDILIEQIEKEFST